MLQRVARVLIGVAASAAVTAALAACGARAHADPAPGPTEQTETAGTPAPAPAQPSAPGPAQPAGENRGLLKAGEMVQAEVPGGTVVAFDYEDESPWNIRVITANGTQGQFEVSRDGATVLSGPSLEAGGAVQNAERRRRFEAAEIDYRQAVAKVTQAVPGRIKKLHLESRDAGVVWEAQLYDSTNTRHRVVIDAGSGEVVSQN